MADRFHIDDILAEDNINAALEHMRKKKTGCGFDGMFNSQLPEYWERNRDEICCRIRSCNYIPVPALQIRRKKPNGGIRLIEIPSVRDRMLQYAMCIVMQPYYESIFSDRSFGFRMGRSTQDAVELCVKEMNEGRVYVADLDIKSYFDRVDQRKLMAMLSADIEDNAVFGMISAYLGMRVMSGCHVFRKVIGLPQGGPISPMLANVYLNKLDWFMEKAGFHFVRYADDIVLLCTDREEAESVTKHVEQYLNEEMGLWLNRKKSALLPAEELHFLGYAFGNRGGEYHASIGNKEWEKMHTGMTHNIHKAEENITKWWDRLGAYNRGWMNYYLKVPMELLEYYALEMDEKEAEMIGRIFGEQADLYETAMWESRSYISPAEWYGRLKERYGKTACQIQKASE